MDKDLEECANLTAAAVDSHKADVIALSGRISERSYKKLRGTAVRSTQVVTILRTFGGDPHAAYRIGRLLQRRYSQVTIFVPCECASAGTLITLAGHRLVMSDEGELGPLDTQIPKRDELMEFGSVLDTVQSFDALTEHAQAMFSRMMVDMRGAGLSTHVCGELAAKLAVGMMQPVFAQIDPVKLGEMTRLRDIATEYGRRLLQDGNNMHVMVLRRLVTAYPSHNFVIDRREAGELYRNVEHPDESLDELAHFLLGKNLLKPDGESAVHDLTLLVPKETQDDDAPEAELAERPTHENGGDPPPAEPGAQEMGGNGAAPAGGNGDKASA